MVAILLLEVAALRFVCVRNGLQGSPSEVVVESPAHEVGLGQIGPAGDVVKHVAQTEEVDH